MLGAAMGAYVSLPDGRSVRVPTVQTVRLYEDLGDDPYLEVRQLWTGCYQITVWPVQSQGVCYRVVGAAATAARLAAEHARAFFEAAPSPVRTRSLRLTCNYMPMADRAYGPDQLHDLRARLAFLLDEVGTSIDHLELVAWAV